ncbi:MAG: helix-turn-helix transcriptional regulator, partial [Bacteroidota bacterium]
MGTRVLRLPEVRHRVGLGRSSIYRLIQHNKFPPPVKL